MALLSLDTSWKMRRYMQRLEGFHDRPSVRVDVSGGHRNVGVTRLELVSRLRILTLRALTKGRPR
jgi:hypothetical protein